MQPLCSRNRILFLSLLKTYGRVFVQTVARPVGNCCREIQKPIASFCLHRKKNTACSPRWRSLTQKRLSYKKHLLTEKDTLEG